ncbi:uncharacterized protein LOC105189188 [Harpegnathos saltator]|uniref:uncharacterized protein LOC105189188 n=1 Tax=Harpegnathos saltator TaxID=610380 RepID=UPI00058B04E3|nr:uncharacterized protein LOC105189188 [Harpegnathos saltator]XP_025155768.1 uncharacterized protein LOC105189188 [Harpegnathos saltator]
MEDHIHTERSIFANVASDHKVYVPFMQQSQNVKPCVEGSSVPVLTPVGNTQTAQPQDYINYNIMSNDDVSAYPTNTSPANYNSNVDVINATGMRNIKYMNNCMSNYELQYLHDRYSAAACNHSSKCSGKHSEKKYANSSYYHMENVKCKDGEAISQSCDGHKSMEIDEPMVRPCSSNNYVMNFSLSSESEEKLVSIDNSDSQSEIVSSETSSCYKQCMDDDPENQRKMTNAKERQRTRDLNNAYDDLKKAIPFMSSEKMSKIQTLKLATKYILYLQFKNRCDFCQKIINEDVNPANKSVNHDAKHDANSLHVMHEEILPVAFREWCRKNLVQINNM